MKFRNIETKTESSELDKLIAAIDKYRAARESLSKTETDLAFFSENEAAIIKDTLNKATKELDRTFLETIKALSRES